MTGALCRCGCGRETEEPRLYRSRGGRHRDFGYASACYRRWADAGFPLSGPPEPVRQPPWWRLEPCGTASAYRRHVRKGEPKDQPCRDAHAAEERWRQQRNKRRREAAEQQEAA